MPPQSNLLGVAVSFAAAFCWGTLYAQVQALDQTIPPFALLAGAYLVATVLLIFAFASQYEQMMKVTHSTGFAREFTSCFVALVTAELLIFYSISLLGGTEASLIEVSYPLWTALLLFIVAGERPSWATKMGGAFIMCGVIIIAVGGTPKAVNAMSSTASKSTNVLGMFVAAVAACCWGFVYATSQRITAAASDDSHTLKRKLTPVQLMALCFLLGTVVLLPLAALMYHPRWVGAHQDHTANNIPVNGVVVTALTLREFAVFTLTLMAAEYLVFYSVSLLGGTEASLIQVSYPVWTGLSLYITQGETPVKATVFGACFILVGVVIITMYGGNPESSPTADGTMVSSPAEAGRLFSGPNRRPNSYDTAGAREGEVA